MNTHYISSDEESERYVVGLRKKKIIKKHKLLQRYIDNIKSKELDETDIKLLKILGFNKVIDLLTRPVDLEKINTEWIDNPLLLTQQYSSFRKKNYDSNGSNTNGGGNFAVEKRVKFDTLSRDEERKETPK